MLHQSTTCYLDHAENHALELLASVLMLVYDSRATVAIVASVFPPPLLTSVHKHVLACKCIQTAQTEDLVRNMALVAINQLQLQAGMQAKQHVSK